MDSSISTLAQVIELAVAPVFMLAGIAGFLNVMTVRLGRIIDRARQAENEIDGISSKHLRDHNYYELKTLWQRAKIINWSIGLCTSSGLLVCLVVASLFVGDFWKISVGHAIVGLFVLALFLLILSLMFFLQEVRLATRTFQITKVNIDQ